MSVRTGARKQSGLCVQAVARTAQSRSLAG